MYKSTADYCIGSGSDPRTTSLEMPTSVIHTRWWFIIKYIYKT